MRWGLAVVGAVLAGACERPTVTPLTGGLEVSPKALAFGDVFVGYPAEQSVTVRNRSVANRKLSVTTAPPFAAQAELLVPGGAELELRVRFEPEQPGAAAGTLTLSEGDEPFVVELTGNAVATPVCSAAPVCHANTFDPAEGACIDSPAPDGTACADACIASGTCAGGACLGTGPACDDGNRCTIDACDPARGCSHLAVECASPANACKAARCDPAAGCVESDVRDGTACGPSDCVTARVCLLGECQSLSVPEGAACGESSPCQGAGSCAGGACVRPAPAILHETWGYTFPPLHHFAGVSDALQNLYWFECGAICRAVSFTRDGAMRFSAPIPIPDVTYHLLAGDKLIGAREDRLFAVNTNDGSAAWSLTLEPNPPGAPDTARGIRVVGLAADASSLIVTAYRSDGTGARQGSVFKLSAATGATVWVTYHDAVLTGPVLDEQGNVYAGYAKLVSLAPNGALRWSLAGNEAPIAVFNGDLLLGWGHVRSAADGSERAPALRELLNNPLMLPAGRVVMTEDWSQLRIEAHAFTPGSAVPAWRTLVNPMHGTNWTTWSAATSNGGFLVGAGDSRHPNWLKAFDGSGAERYACQLGAGIGGAPLDPPVALLDGRWAVETGNRLSVFSVPGERPATRGWVTSGGNASGSRRPLP